jgi:hypothetical protein
MNSAPILFLIFNRPDLTARVFAEIREAQPAKLFIAADGPRADHPQDETLCKKTRDIVLDVDWPCDFHTLFREQNLGCGKAVSSAITWFFEQVDEGIILEDDCIPHPSFFRYCTELLAKYREDTRVMTVTGARFPTPDAPALKSSYDFSIYHHIWGWATWKRAWDCYEHTLSEDHPVRDPEKLGRLLQDPDMTTFWSGIIADYASGDIDTWDFPWLFSCWKHQGLSIRPQVNLISNNGFGEHATHTRRKYQHTNALPLEEINFPLIPPGALTRNMQLEKESVQTFTPKDPEPEKMPPPLMQRILQKLHPRRLSDG